MKITLTLIMKLLMVLVCLILKPVSLFSCFCYPSTASFCESVNENNHIVEVVVIDKPESYNLEVKILSEIALTIIEDTILILGQDGFNCGENMGLFEIGDTLIFGLLNMEIQDVNIQETYNWYLDGCLLNYLRVENGLITGKIREDLFSSSIEDFNNSIDDCLAIEIDVGVINIEDSNIRIYPNPIIDEFFIDLSTNTIAESIEIYDINGKKVLNERNDLENGKINLVGIPSGLYFLKIYSDGRLAIKRIVKK